MNPDNDNVQILIAEDSPTQAEQLKHLLEKHNFKVLVSKNGKEALKIVKKHKPSLIISDILMPEMNGYELCKAIKSDEVTLDIPVILLTSLAYSEDVLEGISCGADNFITKPYREDYLISHIKQILTNRELNKNERVRVGVEILFGGKKRFITASQQQMLTLLISTYEAAVERNNELVQARDDLKKLNEHLEELVVKRTAALSSEIAEREKSEVQVKRLNRVYALLSNINQTIVRVHSIEQLLKDVCMIAVDDGKFRSSWIGLINDHTNEIETTYSAGLIHDLIHVSPDHNPVLSVIRTGEHIISNNINSDTALSGTWKQHALSLGFQSFATFPIMVLEKVTGSFCIYSNEINFFNELEISLLDEMATDISFALGYIYKESERKKAEERQTLTARILAILNKPNEWQQLIKDILTKIKEFTDFEAIGIRLKERDDYPYIETNGFPEYFVEMENYLCARDLDGKIVYNTEGSPLLACMCGNIISHRTDPALPFFTKGGSFWSNNTTELLAITTEKDRQAPTRNCCNREGYESVALIPLQSGDEIIGLLQLNDKRTNRFTVDLIQFFEKLGSSIGIAFKKMQYEKQIKESEERFRRLTENAQDIIYRYDFLPVNRFIYISPAATKITGYTPEEHYADAGLWLKLVHPDDIHLLNEISGYFGHPLILRWLRKDGTIIWIDQRNVPIYDKQENLIAIEGISRDITEQRLAVDKLAQERILLHTLIDNLPDNIYVKDTNMRKVLANKADLALIGKPEMDVIGKDDSELFPAEVASQFMDDDRSVIEKGETILDQEELIVNDFGQNIWLLTSKLPLRDHEGHITGLIGIGHNITGRKQAEELLKEREQKLKEKNEEYHKLNQEYLIVNEELTESIERVQKMNEALLNAKEKAEESDRLKTAFLANMSHEIRTPMNGILGFAELLKRPDLSGEKQQEFISIIEQSGERMLNIISDIIDISRIESGVIEIFNAATNINEQNVFIYNFFKPEVEAKGIKFSYKNSLPENMAVINTDKEKIYRILGNLIKNAIKFSNEGSIEFGYEKTGRFLEFFVRDTGKGIPQEQHGFIFERFRQGSESLNRNYEGAGLGLSISKAYVEALGGKIWMESEPGKGSVFYFTIPCNCESCDMPATTHNDFSDSARDPIRNLKLLIVEDNDFSSQYLTEILNNNCSEILYAGNGAEAVDICKKNKDIDLIMMDIKMPVLDGLEATRQIRQFNKDVIIIVQTAFGMVGDKEKALEAGCDDYLSKPIKQALLADLIKSYFEPQEGD
jgi:PAS domain S-box-containing protein